ncbi:MAG: DUF1553 domain-containing protein [Opitutaceae bacterium]|nr:DUF1553 domain-containing protein [Opitutaceae bacterium]
MALRGANRFFPCILAALVSWNLPAHAVETAERPPLPAAAARPVTFLADVQPIFTTHCLECHGPEKQKGGWRADDRENALHEGDSYGPNILPGNSAASPLIQFVAHTHPELKMPKKGTPLTTEEVGILRAWIDQGAVWETDARAPSAKAVDPLDWWSLKALARPAVPSVPGTSHPIDRFLQTTLSEKGLRPSPEADRRTLLRRLSFDLTGLPPTPEEMAAFLADTDPQAYERRVDAYLASPRYGERWARHWLDVAHYGETHGYDKDKPRPHAWPYRDYVIRAFNQDKPYGRFVQEQIAGDVLYPFTRDGVEALGFIAAGPWDFIGHAEVAEDKTDGKIARNLDRDDMVASTMNTFTSTTLQCARCHDHKFDRFATQETYYGLQSVFAALDRTDVNYDLDPAIGWQRGELQSTKTRLLDQVFAWETLGAQQAGAPIAALDDEIKRLQAAQAEPVNFTGYQSPAAPNAATERWVQLDLRRPVNIDRLQLFAAQGDPRKPRDARGFPLRFKVELSDDPLFREAVVRIVDHTGADVPNPGVDPLSWPVGRTARYVRITATLLSKVKLEYLFALAEVKVWDTSGANAATGAGVSAPDVEDFLAPRWTLENLVDGNTPEAMSARQARIVAVTADRLELVKQAMGPELRLLRDKALGKLAAIDQELASLPAQATVYAGAVHRGEGTFVGTGAKGGKPRVIHVLHRGDVNSPKQLAHPGAVAIIPGVPAEFRVADDAPEGERRAALARWLTDPANPLTWRSIVNRVWQYHFGRAIVDSPNDFGRMGQKPSHPELLDWLAVEFRDGGQSFKSLSRLIVTSAAYRQVSTVTAGHEAATALDADNRLLWRMNPRRLEAEAVRDAILFVTGKLDLTPGGPSYRDFVVEQPTHSPHYRYGEYDPNDPASHRRTIYRMIVRSQPQPLLSALDCADPSLSVEKRNESGGALQALALMNNRFVVAMSQTFASRLAQEGGTPAARIDRAYQLAFGRSPTEIESATLAAYAGQFGWANACRLLLNLNEFAFVD